MKCHTHFTTCSLALLLLLVSLFFGMGCNSAKKLSRVINQEKITIDSTHADSTHIVKEKEKETNRADNSSGSAWSVYFDTTGYSKVDWVTADSSSEDGQLIEVRVPAGKKRYQARVKVSPDGSIDIESNQPIAGIKGSSNETHTTATTKEKEKIDSGSGSKTDLKKEAEKKYFFSLQKLV